MVFSPFERRRLRQLNVTADAMAWRAMNAMAGSADSHSLTRLEQLMTEDVEETKGSDEGGTTVPQGILDLLPTGQLTSHLKVGLGLRRGERRWLHKLFDVPMLTDTSTSSERETPPVLYTNFMRAPMGTLTAPAALYRQRHDTDETKSRPKITDNAEMALQCMFKRHASMRHQASSFDPKGILSRVDAELLLHWVWDIYRPEGKPVMEALQKQCESRLERYWETCLLPSAPDVVLIGVNKTRVGVTYAGFAKWFTACMQELVKARDMFPLPYEGWFEDDNDDAIRASSSGDDEGTYGDLSFPSSQHRLIASLTQELYQQQRQQQPQPQPQPHHQHSTATSGTVTPNKVILPPLGHSPTVPTVQFGRPRSLTNDSDTILPIEEHSREVLL